MRGELRRASFQVARIVSLRDSSEPAEISGASVRLSNFYCERCQDKRATTSGPKGFLEYTILPAMLIWHIRCHYCGDRYATWGFGKNRIVFRRETTMFVRRAATVVLCAAALAGAVTFIILR